jgi:hypothetical protein
VTGQDLIMGRRFITMFAASLVVVGLFVPVVHHLRSSSPAGPAGPPAGIPVPGPLTTSSTNYIGDPDIVAVPAAASPTGRAGYVLFSTSDYIANVPTEWSTDLRHWTQLPDALPDSPEWSDRRNANTKTWSPSVMFIDGRWVMYVTTRDFTAGRQCIAVAVAEHPAGPYRPVGAGPLVSPVDPGGSNDPAGVRAAGGQLELAWKSDGDAIRIRTSLWSQELAPDGLSLEGAPNLLLQSDARWEQGNIEAPELVPASGAGWWLFYSGSQWDRPRSYATGLAWCADLAGTCQAVGQGPWLAGSVPRAVAPGGLDVFTTLAGRTEMAVSTLSWIRWSFGGHHWYGWNRNLLVSALDLGGNTVHTVADGHTVHTVADGHTVHTVDRGRGLLGRKAT